MLTNCGLVGITAGWQYAPPTGWIAAALAYLWWTWALIGPMDSDATASLALHVDPTRPLADSVIMLASFGSLAGVGYLLIATKVHDVVAGVVGILSVVASWLVVHTVFTLRYAAHYYAEPYLSPFYSPCLATSCPEGATTAGASVGGWWRLSTAVIPSCF